MKLKSGGQFVSFLRAENLVKGTRIVGAQVVLEVVSRVLCKFITALKPSKEVGSFALSRLGSISNATPF